MKNRNIVFATILLTLGCFGSLQKAQAVVPAPDGGYGAPSYGPGNTAEGTDALFSLTNSGYWNTALGFEALYHDTSGSVNTATGVRALFSNTNGTYNAAYGYAALYDNTTGSLNTALGNIALANNIDGDRNTATGFGALYRNQQSYNTATGYAALYNHDFYGFNTAVGFGALYNGGGEEDTAIGFRALYNGGGPYGENTAIGSQALYNNSSGSKNTALGNEAGSNVTTANNVICIGSNVLGANVSNSCYIGSIFGRPASGGSAVFVTANGRLGTLNSSQRFKEKIKPMDKASDVIHALKPVTFRYEQDIDPQGIPQFVLVAEDVAKVNPDLVVRDEKGQLCTVRYEAVNAMLLNEFLKEHKRVQELKATAAKQESSIAEQRKDFEAAISQQRQEIQILTAQLKEQSKQIQKVSVQVEATNFATERIRCGGPAQRLATNDY